MTAELNSTEIKTCPWQPIRRPTELRGNFELRSLLAGSARLCGVHSTGCARAAIALDELKRFFGTSTFQKLTDKEVKVVSQLLVVRR